MNNPLWRRIQRYVTSGRETPKADLKLTLDLSSKAGKAELTKDVTAIANTPGGDGFIIIGVQDVKARQSDDPQDFIPGFQTPDGPDAFHRQIVDTLTQFCNRVPIVEYDELYPPGSDYPIGVITIKRSANRPHSTIRGSGDVEQHQIWVRRGTASYPASVDEIEEMMGKVDLPASIIINMSGHPLTDVQQKQIQRETYIEELIELPVHFNLLPVRPQVESIVDTVGLTLDEWQTKSVILALPGLAPGSAALLAYVHGLRGSFPKVLWLHPHPQDKSRYDAGEVIDLQALRDTAREIRVVHRKEVTP